MGFLWELLLLGLLPVVLCVHDLVTSCVAGAKGKHCITRPPDCLSTPKTCTQVAAISVGAAGNLHIDIRAKGPLRNRWVGLAFSDDDHMGNDGVIHCVQNDTTAVALLTYNMEHKNIGTVGVDQKYLHPLDLKAEDDSLHCSVDLDRKFKIKSQEFDLSSPHYLLFATGPVRAGKIVPHDKNPIVSTDAYSF
ncbi:hypothetical protein RvY_12848 [Ramazzottius varieornatus]|uniref:DOMON domain-containing protein n=1 Tax=Ramazzottius varieornatus TaxID=947166 RepID=A0A1D1VKW8_RAMVA|nr:hypothetical protein RvY_12848 [Ramazzottius varieornatus]